MTDDITTQPESRPAFTNRSIFEGVAIGVVYGLLLRLFFGHGAVNRWIASHDRSGVSAIMTLGFLLLGPFIIGLLTVSRMEASGPVSIWGWILLPWLSVLVTMLIAALSGMEGAICIVMATPVALLLSSVGGMAGGALMRMRRLSGTTLSCLAALPFLIAPAEARLTAPLSTRTVSSEIRIHASTSVVWQNIKTVPPISPSELRPNWTHSIGFPRPVEATLSYEGFGGVRHATFERGLTFIETVTSWQPDHRLAFSIKADTKHIPPATLDEHVTIGGPYFDVLDGEYTIEPLTNGDVLLHLTSHQRLSTDFNSYAGLWTDSIMQNLQTSILQVIQHRCEDQP